MSEAFIGEIRLAGFGFPPKGWALCNGQLLLINSNQALFSLLGIQYGGDGIRTFALPNLQSRIPIHYNGSNYPIGSAGGEAQHTLIPSEIPAHTHDIKGSSNSPNVPSPAGAMWASVSAGALPYATSANATMAPQTMASTGGQPHPNMPPYQVLNFMIALTGIFPQRN